MNPHGIAAPNLDPAALAAYTLAVIRARQEYADHPFVTSCPGASHGCPWVRTTTATRRAAASKRYRDRMKETSK